MKKENYAEIGVKLTKEAYDKLKSQKGSDDIIKIELTDVILEDISNFIQTGETEEGKAIVRFGVQDITIYELDKSRDNDDSETN